MSKFNEALHPRGFGGKFGHGTGTKKAATPPAKKYGAKDVTSGGAMKGRNPAAVANPKNNSGKKRPVAAVPTPQPKRAAPAPVMRKGSPVTPKKAAVKPTPKHVVKAKQLSVGMRPDGTMDYDARAAYVDRVLTKFFHDDVSTEATFKDYRGNWTPERRAQQKQLLDDIWNEHAAQVPNEGKAIFSGGLGGAGKGFALGPNGENINTDADWNHPGKAADFFTINPDTIKAKMAERGMIPDYDSKLTPMELSPAAHEEASEMAKRLAEKAYKEKKNVIWDFTMASEKSVVKDRLEPMRAAGYTEIGAIFVDTTVARSIEQAQKRWRNGMDKFIKGTSLGGRFLPSGATKGNMPTKGSEFESKNREVFEAVKAKFDGTVLKSNYDGNMKDLATTGKGLPK